jgi:hypothetical protein
MVIISCLHWVQSVVFINYDTSYPLSWMKKICSMNYVPSWRNCDCHLKLYFHYWSFLVTKSFHWKVNSALDLISKCSCWDTKKVVCPFSWNVIIGLVMLTLDQNTLCIWDFQICFLSIIYLVICLVLCFFKNSFNFWETFMSNFCFPDLTMWSLTFLVVKFLNIKQDFAWLMSENIS